MNFVTARELRLNTGDLWKMLEKEHELVVTLNGRPVALIAGISGESLEDTLKAVRRARGERAIRRLQDASLRGGLDQLSQEDIAREIRRTRKERAG